MSKETPKLQTITLSGCLLILTILAAIWIALYWFVYVPLLGR